MCQISRENSGTTPGGMNTISIQQVRSAPKTRPIVYKTYVVYTYPNPTRYFIFNLLIISLIFIENKCHYDAIRDLKREKKKVRQKVGSNHWLIASKRHDTQFTICASGADDLFYSAVLLLVLPVPLLTDVSSSQQ